MLASPPVRTAGERVAGLWPALGAAGICFCALFFGAGSSDAPLVWIGGLALLLAAVAGTPALDRPAALLAWSLFGLALWAGLTAIWSVSPDRSWSYANRTLVYAAFALIGLAIGARTSRTALAQGAAALLAVVVGWALVAKCIPALYSDYGRLSRLRAPLTYWNELALLCDAGVPLALWLATRVRRAAGTVLLYALVVTLLLTYSRFGVALACLAALAWVLLDRRRLESLAAILVAAGAGGAVFGIALALPGITNDAQPRTVRVHDGWIFLLVTIAGAGVVVLASRIRLDLSAELRARLERTAAIAALVLAIAGLAVSLAFAGRIWREFTNPVQLGLTHNRLASASSSNRWHWWQEAWHAFTRHPGGGTGAGTFELTNQQLRTAPISVDEPHNTPLQFLSETGIVGFLLFLGAAGGALWAAWRARAEPAGLALGISVAAFFVHSIVDKDWNYVATCGPLLLLAGALAAPSVVRPRRFFVTAFAVVVALAGVYSLAAPWLAQRELESATTVADAKRAHSYDPLSVDALQLEAALEDAANHQLRAERLYRQAVDLEPQNSDTWYALGEFYFSYGAWRLAYDALNNAYTYDPLGPAGQPCGLLDQARKKAFNYTPPKLKCPG